MCHDQTGTAAIHQPRQKQERFATYLKRFWWACDLWSVLIERDVTTLRYVRSMGVCRRYCLIRSDNSLRLELDIVRLLARPLVCQYQDATSTSESF